MKLFYRNMEFLRAYANLNKQALKELLRKLRKAVKPYYEFIRLPRRTATAASEASAPGETMALISRPDRQRSLDAAHRRSDAVPLYQRLRSGSVFSSRFGAPEGAPNVRNEDRMHRRGSETSTELLDAREIDHEERILRQLADDEVLRETLSSFENMRIIQDREQVALRRMMDRLEAIYAHTFTQRNLDTARMQLREPASKHTEGDVFNLGFNLGYMLPITILFIIVFFMPYSDIDMHKYFLDTVPIFRASFLFIEYIWLYVKSFL